MAALISNKEDFREAIDSLIELDYAAVAAYQEAIDHLKDQTCREKLSEFKKDHERHIRELGALVIKMGGEPPTGAGFKKVLTQGKVMIADLMGDKAILIAMRSNEDDTNAAYAAINKHPRITSEAIDILVRGLEDEKMHREWIVKTLEQMN